VVAGTIHLSVNPPPVGSPGSSALRFRLTKNNPAGALGVGGYWPDGEVEDRLVTLA